MEKLDLLSFLFGALALTFGIFIKPYTDILVMRLKRLFSRKERAIEQHNLEVIVERMNELEEQMNNVAETHFRRETNRKNNIRREVRDYLKELQK